MWDKSIKRGGFLTGYSCTGDLLCFPLICFHVSSLSLIFPSVFGLVITSSFSLSLVSSCWLSLSVHPCLPTNCFPSSHHSLFQLCPSPTSPCLHLCQADGEAACGYKTVRSSFSLLAVAFQQKEGKKTLIQLS